MGSGATATYSVVVGVTFFMGGAALLPALGGCGWSQRYAIEGAVAPVDGIGELNGHSTRPRSVVTHRLPASVALSPGRMQELIEP